MIPAEMKMAVKYLFRLATREPTVHKAAAEEPHWSAPHLDRTCPPLIQSVAWHRLALHLLMEAVNQSQREGGGASLPSAP